MSSQKDQGESEASPASETGRPATQPKVFGLFGPTDAHSICQRYVQKAKSNARVKAMVDAINGLGCPFDLDEVVVCKPCNIAATGGFIPNTEGLREGQYQPKVVICEDNLLGSKLVAKTLAHELIHAYDQCRAKVNWNSCYHYACTEIRASALSGECDYVEEFDRGNFGWRAGHQKCVKRRAAMSLAVSDACRDRAQEIVDHVFDRCYHDTAPFERLP